MILVILCTRASCRCRADLSENTVRVTGMLYGDADALNSAYHISYNMLLNMLRVEDADPDFLVKSSFHQFQQEAAAPALEVMLSCASIGISYANALLASVCPLTAVVERGVVCRMVVATFPPSIFRCRGMKQVAGSRPDAWEMRIRA